MQRQAIHGVFLIFIAAWGLVGCAPQQNAVQTTLLLTPTSGVTLPAATPTSPPSALPTNTVTLVASTMDVPTTLATPTASVTTTATPLPAASTTPTATATTTITPQPSPVPIDRHCPNPVPAKPDYNHYWLASQAWPTPDPVAESHFWLAKPLPGGGRVITSQILPYGFDGLGRYLLHNGSDMAEPMGTPVLAVADGTVVVAQADESEWYGWRCNWYGHLVVIQLNETWQGQPLFALYGHVLNISVMPGDRVVRGQQVAEVGIGGAAALPHLHFELRVGENDFAATRNPMLWLSPGETRGVIAGRLLDREGRPWQGHPVLIQRLDEVTETLTAWTYVDDPQHIINPDEGFAENFVLADLRPGTYEVTATVQGEAYRATVMVSAGAVSTVELTTAPYKTPTPTAPSDTIDQP